MTGLYKVMDIVKLEKFNFDKVWFKENNCNNKYFIIESIFIDEEGDEFYKLSGLDSNNIITEDLIPIELISA